MSSKRSDRIKNQNIEIGHKFFDFKLVLDSKIVKSDLLFFFIDYVFKYHIVCITNIFTNRVIV